MATAILAMMLPISLASGVLIGLHWQKRAHQEHWFQQGYNAGAMRGWGNAAAQLSDDADYMHRSFAHQDKSQDYLDGYADAAERLFRYWDKMTERAHGTHQVAGNQGAAERSHE
jgi:hypothetical protein